jgi:membrane fusion protein, multidrug efflux system
MNNMKKIIVIVIAIGLVLVLVLRLKSNHNKINAKKEISTDLGYVNVNVSKVQRLAFAPELNLVGTLNAITEVNVSAETQGVITSLNAELGQYKTKGSVTATIDSRVKQLVVNSAKINSDKLRKDYERYKNLYSGGTATEQELDDAKKAYESATIELEQAEKELNDATVKCPVSGIVTEKHVEEGSYVNNGSSIITLVDISKLKVKINVSESNVYQLQIGGNAEITSTVYPGVKFNGNITYISPKGDESHNYLVEVAINNSQKYPLKAGTFVKVLIKLPKTGNSLYFPREALQGSITDAKVYVARNGKAELRNIVAANGNDKYLEAISGLKEGEEIIITGQVNLSDGKAIKISR